MSQRWIQDVDGGRGEGGGGRGGHNTIVHDRINYTCAIVAQLCAIARTRQ